MSENQAAAIQRGRTHNTRPCNGRASLYSREQYECLITALEVVANTVEEVTLDIHDRGTAGHELAIRGMDPSHVSLYDIHLKMHAADSWGAESKVTQAAFRIDELLAALRQLAATKAAAVRFRLVEPVLNPDTETKAAAARAAGELIEQAQARLDQAQAISHGLADKEQEAASDLTSLQDEDSMLKEYEEAGAAETGVKAAAIKAARAELNAKLEQTQDRLDSRIQAKAETDHTIAEYKDQLEQARAAGREPDRPRRLELAGEHETHTVRTIEGASVSTPLPKLPYTVAIQTESTKDMLGALKRLAAVQGGQGYVTLSLPDSTEPEQLLNLYGKGDASSLSLDYPACRVHILRGGEPALEATYALEYLLPTLAALTKGAGARHWEPVSIQVASSKPCLWQARVQLDSVAGSINYHLAPRVEN